MSSRARTISSFVFAGVLTACCTVALATGHPSQGTPGWKYGGLNCGCVANPNASLTSCLSCCTDAGLTGALPAADVSDCQAFCNQATFPCYSGS